MGCLLWPHRDFDPNSTALEVTIVAAPVSPPIIDETPDDPASTERDRPGSVVVSETEGNGNHGSDADLPGPTRMESSHATGMAKGDKQVHEKWIASPSKSSPKVTSPMNAKPHRPQADERGTGNAPAEPARQTPGDPGPASTPPDKVEETAAAYEGHGLTNPLPRYPRHARKRGIEGQVVLFVRVTADGKAGSVTVRTSSGHAILDQAAIEAVTKWIFTPARRDGIAVPGEVLVPVTFRLEAVP